MSHIFPLFCYFVPMEADYKTIKKRTLENLMHRYSMQFLILHTKLVQEIILYSTNGFAKATISDLGRNFGKAACGKATGPVLMGDGKNGQKYTGPPPFQYFQ